MPDPRLTAWFRDGVEFRMGALSESEARLSQALTSAVAAPAPENGEIARAAIARAQSENWEAAMAFVKAVGP